MHLPDRGKSTRTVIFTTRPWVSHLAKIYVLQCFNGNIDIDATINATRGSSFPFATPSPHIRGPFSALCTFPGVFSAALHIYRVCGGGNTMSGNDEYSDHPAMASYQRGRSVLENEVTTSWSHPPRLETKKEWFLIILYSSLAQK